MKRAWSIEEDALALLMPLAGSRLICRLLGRSRGSVIGRQHRLRKGLREPLRAFKPRPQPRWCENCKEAELLAYQRRFCSVGCRTVGLRYVRSEPRKAWAGQRDYLNWYSRLPEAKERRRLLDNARAEAKERRCSVREVLLAWGEKPGEVKADYGLVILEY